MTARPLHGAACLAAALLALSSPLRAAPVPDYGPTGTIWTHEQLRLMAPRFVQQLHEALGPRHLIEGYDPGQAATQHQAADPDASDSTLLWLRDYQLLYHRDGEGRLRALRPLSLNPNRSRYLPTAGHELPTTWLPLVHEQGNLVVAGPWVLVGERLITDNDGRHSGEPDLRQLGYRSRSRDEVRATLANALGASVDRVQVFPGLPAEGTGHIDLMILPLSDQRVLVPRIEEQAVQRLRSFTGQVIAHEARHMLDHTAQRLGHLGLEVVRAPMLPPVLLRAVDAEPGTRNSDTIYFSPANALLTHSGGRRIAWIAHMHDQIFEGRYADLNRRYRTQIKAIFKAEGYEARFIEATRLARHLGLFRCVTAAAPAP